MTYPTSNPIARELDDFWRANQSLWQQWWYEADLDVKMAIGQQDLWNSYYNINYKNQKLLQFNKILRILNMIGGHQRKNRMATVAIPSDNQAQNGQMAEDLSGVLSWVKREDNTYEKISDCFDGSNMCGLNLLQVWMDYREDPEGMIRTSRIPYNAFVMDPYWMNTDLSDCDRIWTRHYLTTKQLLSIFPSLKSELPMLMRGGNAYKDGKFQFMAQNYQQYQVDMYAYDEYWVRDYKKAKRLLDKRTGETAPWEGTKEQFMLMRHYNPNLDLLTYQKPTIKQHILVNNECVYEELSPDGIDRFPFIPFMCYFFPEVQNYAYRYMGVPRNIRDSQIELNKRRNRMLDIMDAQVQSGLMIKEDCLVNPEDAFIQGPGKILYFKQTSNLATDVVPIPAPPVPPGWLELGQTLDSEIMSIAGATEELFGEAASGKDMSGFLSQLRMGAGLVSWQGIFDNLNASQKALGDLLIEFIQKNFSKEKVTKILGREPDPQFASFWDTKYYCVVEEAELTSTQRQLQFLQALQLREYGIPVPTEYLLQKSSLQGKKELSEAIMQAEEQQVMLQQAQAQAELEEKQVLARSLEARAQSDFAGAEEKRTRSVANIGLAKERSAQAAHDRAKTAVENARALNELHDMEEDRLIKLANFVVDLQQKQKTLSMGEEDDAAETATELTQDIQRAETASQVTQ